MEWIILIAAMVMIWILRRPPSGVKTITTRQLKTMLQDKDKCFIDVRTEREYKARGIKEFINIPLGSDLSKLPKNKEIVVICQSGIRAMKACKQLKQLGYKDITHVRGGMNSY